MSDHRQIMNKAAFTAILALTISLVLCTACASVKEIPERGGSAAEDTTAGAVSDNRGGSGIEGKGQKGSERTAGEEILEKAGRTAAETAAEAVTGKNTTADEDEKEDDEAQQSLPDDHMERQENSQEQIWESEDSEKDDRDEKEEDDAVEESGDDPEEEEHENSHGQRSHSRWSPLRFMTGTRNSLLGLHNPYLAKHHSELAPSRLWSSSSTDSFPVSKAKALMHRIRYLEAIRWLDCSRYGHLTKPAYLIV